MTPRSSKGIALAALIALMSCSPEPGNDLSGNAHNESLDNQSSFNCDNSTMQKADLSTVEIEGARVASKGQRLNYQLSKTNECAPDSDVIWKTVAADKSIDSDIQFQPTFNKAGTYIVAAQVSDADSGRSRTLAHKTVVLSDQAVVSAPEVAQVGVPVTFSLAIPEGQAIDWVTWNFGQGPNMVGNTNSQHHTFSQTGSYTVEVTLDPLKETSKRIYHQITIVESLPDSTCTDELSISGPTEVTLGNALNLAVHIPDCLVSEISSLNWDFGDGSENSGNQSVSHIYEEVGSFTVQLDVYLPYSADPWVTLIREVAVTEVDDKDTQIEPPDDREPFKICRNYGAGREFFTEIYTETAECGSGGTKTLSFRDEVYEECLLQGEFQQWVEISRDQHLLSESDCQGQFCVLPDGSSLANGESQTLYMTETPEASCTAVSESRQCLNGNLQGSSNFKYLNCNDGCPGFGSNGTIQTDIVTGIIKVPLTCQFGEDGFENVYTELSDRKCESGTVVTYNTRQGPIQAEDRCPSYAWAPTEQFTKCSADCGGNQSRLYVCQNDQGMESSEERCTEAKPVESQVCDGNPEAVRRQEVAVTPEEERSTNCPANQIGSIVKKRDIVTTSNYACIAHEVQIESEDVAIGPWEEESYCRNFIAWRCTHDAASNSEARGRIAWLDKCKEEVPVIAEYMASFEDRKLPHGSREYYPTFMDSAYSPEELWKAPNSIGGTCDVPSTVYVAAVCISSCATPEQQILANDGSGFSYTSFLKALTSDQPYAATLPKDGSMSSKRVQRTAVDQWVTELFDTEHVIVEFTMASGRSLRLTENHPVLTERGTMKLAEHFEVGENLVEVGGNLDEIVSIERVAYFGKVYNLFVKSDVPQENIVVTNGYLNGTAFFQNEGADHMNRVLLRTKLTRGVLK